MRELLSIADIKPQINQIEIHPLFWRRLCMYLSEEQDKIQ